MTAGRPTSPDARRRLLVPEVVQTSAMDCGPAALKCLCEGFGISVSYGHLREACQTDVDGTSIDTLEEVACQLGLEAQQIMLPVDHLLLHEAHALPALIVTCLPSGVTHFVVAWRRHGRLVQVMDPATGRRWPTCQRFLDELYMHVCPVPVAAWRTWAGSAEFVEPLCRRLAHLGLSNPAIERLLEASLGDPAWRPMATLDAATRTLTTLLHAGGLRRGQEARRVLEMFLDRVRHEAAHASQSIPAPYWSVQPTLPGPQGEEQLLLRGTVLVRIRGRRAAHHWCHGDAAPERTGKATPFSAALMAALAERPSHPGRDLLRLLHADGLLTPALLAAALLLAASGMVVEAVLFRGLLDLARELTLAGQRFGAMLALLVFASALLLLEGFITAALLRLGRRLETRLRIAFLEKLPHLSDWYFQSRLTSDMAERSHTVHVLRLLPELGGQLMRALCGLALTTAGMIWLAPSSAPVAILAAVLTVVLPLAAQPVLVERELRSRSHNGALSRFYLDALLGLAAVRAHGAEQALRREHENLLSEWAQARLGLQRAVVTVEGLQSLAGPGVAAWRLLSNLTRGGEGGGVLLLVYWALHLPVLGQEVAVLARQYPAYRNITLRLLEPLGAPEETPETPSDQEPAASALPDSLRTPEPSCCPSDAVPALGVAIAMHGVHVQRSGRTILADIHLTIEAGSHVAIVGPSGAGKSSLVGLLLGWHGAATGQVLVDGKPLAGPRLEQLRGETAWVDPAVQLWNRSLLDNLRYGAPAEMPLPLQWSLEAADLHEVVEKLPDGLQTALGEGGALVSGGEGQRVRLARALLRPAVRLVILDEPCRGLERSRRRELLSRARRVWQQATLLCITHDVGETQTFERVLVVVGGRIVEDGAPADLAQQPGSCYRTLLEAEAAVRQGLWSDAVWRRLRLKSGRLVEEASHSAGHETGRHGTHYAWRYNHTHNPDTGLSLLASLATRRGAGHSGTPE